MDTCDAYDGILGRHLLVRVQPYEAEGESAAAEGTVVMVRDITGYKGAQMQSVRLFQEAEHLRAFNESIVRCVTEAILVQDAAGILTFANPAAERLLGYHQGELIGLHWSAVVPEDHRETVSREMMLRAQGIEGHYETAMLSQAGEVIPVICSACPLFEDGRFAGTLSAFTDIREYKRIEAYMRGQDRLATVGQMAAGIAHDFNNILTGIIGFAQLACMRADIPEAAKADLEPIIVAGHRAEHLIRQILDFSRTSLVQRQPIALSPFLREMVRFLQRTIPENVEMTMEMGPGEYLVNADPVQMQQVLTNLAVNARDAMPDGGKLRFRLAHLTLEPDDAKPLPDMRTGGWIVLSVSDTGTGIPEDVLPRIYEPFFTTKEVGEGTGLGLSQVYGIVRQHDGFIDVETKVGEGTTFTIYLPALSLQLGVASDGRSPGEEPARGQGETVLLVEDEPWVLAACKAMLEQLGYRVLAASDSTQALYLYRQHKEQVALVLTDMVMPGMDGQELFQALRDEDPEIKVALMTGYPLEEQDETLLEERAVTWVQKPLDVNQLAQVVTWACRRGKPPAARG
jgi:two-component system cell cycle sensor histidine kinase/response regulator CckA